MIIVTGTIWNHGACGVSIEFAVQQEFRPLFIGSKKHQRVVVVGRQALSSGQKTCLLPIEPIQKTTKKVSQSLWSTTWKMKITKVKGGGWGSAELIQTPAKSTLQESTRTNPWSVWTWGNTHRYVEGICGILVLGDTGDICHYRPRNHGMMTATSKLLGYYNTWHI